MNKKINIFFVLILLMFFLVLISSKGLASEDLVISKWNLDANILNNGDLSIVEDITFKFNDDFNGVFREVNKNGTSGIEDIKVSEIINNTSKMYEEVSNAENGDKEVFVVDESEEIIKIKIFSPSKDEEKTFRISYVVKNVAVKYNDIGELYYKLIGKENNTPITSFTANIILPSADTQKLTKLFIHGPTNYESSIVNEKTYKLEVENVKANELIEVRIIFPKEFISLSENIRNIDNYDNIIQEELEYQKKIKKENYSVFLGTFTIILSQLGLGLFVIFVIKFRRKKINIKNQTNIPEDSSPAIAALLTQGIIKVNAAVATILDLVRKRYLDINEVNKEEFMISQYKPIDNKMLNHEKKFCELLINKIGNGVSVSTKDIENYRKEKNREFYKFFDIWNTKIKEDAKNKGYYDSNATKYGLLFLIYSLVLFIISILTLSLSNILGLPALVVAIIMFVYGIFLFFRLSDYGYVKYQEWLYFKIYMSKQNIDLAKIEINNYEPDISLIYALALGVKNKVNVNLDNLDEKFLPTNWFFWYVTFMSNSTFMDTINKSIANTFPHSNTTFTSGGGSSAGGGGAGGF